MLSVGITGQQGFIGTHLANTLKLYPNQYQVIPFEDNYFEIPEKLQEFVTKCNVIVHLAAVNRHPNQTQLYETNLLLVKKLIAACEASHSRPHILFSSSVQEEKNNLYGNSKKEGRILFENWAKANHAGFSGLIIPNVFGPFGKPFYNSVVATFCYQLTHNQQPTIEIDAEIRLIYVGSLVNHIINIINNIKSGPEPIIQTLKIPHDKTITVSSLLTKLTEFKEQYLDLKKIPNISDPFDRDLFNTLVCYVDHRQFYPVSLTPHIDERGCYVELLRFSSQGQISYSTTKPGITRGNHYHTRKFERFAVIKGKARIEMRRIGTDEVISFALDGNKPAAVDMPIWFTHNITNIGDEELFTVFWISEHFYPENPDTWFEKV